MKLFVLIAIICVANIGNTNGNGAPASPAKYSCFTGTYKTKVTDLAFSKKECDQCGYKDTENMLYCITDDNKDKCTASDDTKIECCKTEDCCGQIKKASGDTKPLEVGTKCVDPAASSGGGTGPSGLGIKCFETDTTTKKIELKEDCAKCGVNDANNEFKCVKQAHVTTKCGTASDKLKCCDQDCCHLDAVKAMKVGFYECSKKKKLPCLVGSYLVANKDKREYKEDCNKCSTNKKTYKWDCITDTNKATCDDDGTTCCETGECCDQLGALNGQNGAMKTGDVMCENPPVPNPKISCFKGSYNKDDATKRIFQENKCEQCGYKDNNLYCLNKGSDNANLCTDPDANKKIECCKTGNCCGQIKTDADENGPIPKGTECEKPAKPQPAKTTTPKGTASSLKFNTAFLLLTTIPTISRLL